MNTDPLDWTELRATWQRMVPDEVRRQEARDLASRVRAADRRWRLSILIEAGLSFGLAIALLVLLLLVQGRAASAPAIALLVVACVAQVGVTYRRLTLWKAQAAAPGSWLVTQLARARLARRIVVGAFGALPLGLLAGLRIGTELFGTAWNAVPEHPALVAAVLGGVLTACLVLAVRLQRLNGEVRRLGEQIAELQT